MEWINTNDYIIGTTNNFIFTNKCACFDLDGTLIKTKSNKKFPINKDDWIFFNNNVPQKLTDHINKNYCIIIITNQASLKNNWTNKIENIIETLNIELKIFCSISHNKYRKPSPLFYREFIPCKKGFFCGDACGRPNDFSDSDYKFAINCGLPCKTPEEIFLNQKQIIPDIIYPIINFDKFIFSPLNKEIIVMVGYPASGKSSIVDIIINKYDYKIVSQDICKTKIKMLKQFQKYIDNNYSIIIDNTNLTPEIRKQFIVNNYNVTCILMNIDMKIIKHNNMFRCMKTNKYIPNVVYNKTKLVEPTLNEGFDRIIVVNNLVVKNNDKDYKLYLI